MLCSEFPSLTTWFLFLKVIKSYVCQTFYVLCFTVHLCAIQSFNKASYPLCLRKYNRSPGSLHICFSFIMRSGTGKANIYIYIYFIRRKMKISFKCHMMPHNKSSHIVSRSVSVYFRKTKVILEKNGGIKEICKTY